MCLLAEGSHDIGARELGAEAEQIGMLAETRADVCLCAGVRCGLASFRIQEP